jgi:hypothetical protein
MVERDYDINGAVSIRLLGRNPVSEVIDRTLSFFRSPPGTPDLTLVIGEFPGEEWVPAGTLVGDRFLYDEDSATTSVLTERVQGRPQRSNVEYVVTGDLRTPGEPVTVHVPRVLGPMHTGRCFRHDLKRGHLRRALLALAGNPFGMQRVVRQAERITEAVIEPFLFYRLPSRGMSLVHGTSFCSQGKAALYAGSANIGKSTLALRFAEKNHVFLGDTLVVLSERGEVLPYPGLVKLHGGHLVMFPELRIRLAEGMGPIGTRLFMSELLANPRESFDLLPQRKMVELFDEVTIPKKCELESVYVVRRGCYKEASCDEADQDVTVSALSTDLFWDIETAPWRDTQFVYSPSAVAGRDLSQEATKLHSRVGEVLRRGISRAKCYSLLLPLEEPVTRAEGFIPVVRGSGQ